MDRTCDHRSWSGLGRTEQQVIHSENSHDRPTPSPWFYVHCDLLLHQRLQWRLLREGAEREEDQQRVGAEHPAVPGNLLLLLSQSGDK